MQDKIDKDSTFHFAGEGGRRKMTSVLNFLIAQNASFVVKYFAEECWKLNCTRQHVQSVKSMIKLG